MPTIDPQDGTTSARTALSLAFEFTRGEEYFFELLRTYRENDEMPMHSASENLFEALLRRRISLPFGETVSAKLDRLRDEGIPRAWALAIGQSLLAVSATKDMRSQLAVSIGYGRIVARVTALAHFSSPRDWTRLWNRAHLGQKTFAWVTSPTEGNGKPTADRQRLLANIAILDNMRADGVDLAPLRAHYSINDATWCPLLHSAATRHNVVLVQHLLEAGLDPLEKIQPPAGEWPCGHAVDVFDIAARYPDNPVAPVLAAWRARQAIERTLGQHIGRSGTAMPGATGRSCA